MNTFPILNLEPRAKSVTRTHSLGIILLLTLLSGSVPTCSLSQAGEERPDHALTIGEKITLHSTILKEDRTCWISLPRSYDIKHSGYHPQYPVLYLLDGNAYFRWTSAMVEFMANNSQIPELIVVAILNTDRNRDLTPSKFKLPAEFAATSDPKELPPPLRAMMASSGGGDLFQRFLKEELIPHIEGKYSANAFRLLAGHSLGGLIAVDDFLRRPPTFNAWIATDPSLSWDDELLLKKATAMLQKTNDFRGLIYLSLSGTDANSADTNPVSVFAELIKGHPSPLLHSTLRKFPAEDHGSTPLVSVRQGLLFVFEGYKFRPANPFGLAEVKEHFEQLSRRLGFPMPPPASLIDQFGKESLWNHETDKALEFFLLNVTNYPCAETYESLANGYATHGETELAAKNFQRCLEFNPNHQEAREWLKQHHRLAN